MEHKESQAAPKEVRELFEKVADAFGLEDSARGVILGDPDVQLDRMALLLGIYEESARLVGDAGRWLKASNSGSPFEGRTPLAYILENPEDNLTLRHLSELISSIEKVIYPQLVRREIDIGQSRGDAQGARADLSRHSIPRTWSVQEWMSHLRGLILTSPCPPIVGTDIGQDWIIGRIL